MNRKYALSHHTFLLITFCTLLLLSSCGSRKFKYSSDTKAAKAADAMANLHSKRLYRFITDWAGVKYKLGGLDKRGIDCSGFALLLNKEIYGVSLPRRSADQAEVIREKNQQQLQEGDLIFFSFGGRAVDHVGIYLNNGFFVHASTSRGIIVEDLTLPAFQRVLVKAGPVK
ncbi:C40 family peptidase [Pedobacter sp. AW31-3R]|uniref:C40 family peptidase n=1 Tax=Pedobacter sp. AW31-3R TaxID=3445781 RepID=UPI003FA128F2